MSEVALAKEHGGHSTLGDRLAAIVPWRRVARTSAASSPRTG